MTRRRKITSLGDPLEDYPDLAAALATRTPRPGGSVRESVLMDLMSEEEASRVVNAMVKINLGQGVMVEHQGVVNASFGIFTLGVWLGQRGRARVPE